MIARAAGLLAGYLADLAFADLQRGHPVAGFGAVAAALERADYRDDRAAGVGHVVVLLGGLAILATAAPKRGVSGAVAVGLGTWASLGGRSLARTGARMADLLDSGDIDAARALLPSLCGRDPATLDADGLARAALESVAENTADATVAPLLWGAVAGLPGVLVYRGANTLDAMIGYRSDRYTRFGWAAARFDDMTNYLPARVTGLLVAACAPLIGGAPSTATLAWRRDAARHPSPNAGVVEASFAGALGVQLGGRTPYRHGVENRPTLGDGHPPTTADLRRAVRLSTLVQGCAAALVAAVALAIGGGRSGR